MIYKVIFSPVAEFELQGAFDWYEGCLTGLGERFVEEVDKSLNTISIYPEAFPVKKAHLHELVINDFPYIIVYEILKHQDIIYILHVFHTSRNPKLKYKK